MNIEQQHMNMVNDLFKDGQAITASLSYEKVGHLHSVLGIMGEAGELARRVYNLDGENVLEELGDLLFYLRKLRASLMLKVVVTTPDDREIAQVTNDLVLDCTDLVDLIKKGVIYNQDYKIDEISGVVGKLQAAIDFIMSYFKFTLDQVLKHNMDKLIGPDGRYPDAEYSDQAAKERADKKAGE